MKNIKIKKLLIILITLLMIGLFFVFTNNIGKTKILQITQSKQNEELLLPTSEQVHSVSLILKELDKSNNVSLAGNKVKISATNGDITFEYFEPHENTVLREEEDQTIQVSKNGLGIKINGIKQNNTYDITIESKDTIEGYTSSFKNAVIEIKADESIIAKVKQITRTVGNEDQTTEGSDENIAVFVDEEDKQINVSDNKNVQIEYVFSAGKRLNEQELQTASWQPYSDANPVNIDQKGWLYSRAKYKDGEYSEIASKEITNIDKRQPEITVTKVSMNNNNNVEIRVNLKDGDETEQYGKSGLYGYAVTTNEQEPSSFTLLGTSDDKNDLVIKDSKIQVGSKVYIWVKDIAGNVKHIAQNIGTVYLDSNKVIYEKIQDAITNAKQEGADTIKLLKDITVASADSDVEIPTGKNITLDLAGQTLTSNKQNAIINNGNLTIKDSNSNGEIVGGKVVGVENYGVKNNGTFKIMSGTISVINETSAYGINSVSGKVYIEGGKIIASNTGIKSSESIYMSRGEIEIKSSNNNNPIYGITGDQITVEMRGGKIIIPNEHNKQDNVFGIKIVNGGTLKIGDNDLNISTDTPSINVNGAGVDCTGTTEFYTGRIEATEGKSISGNYTVRSGYVKHTFYNGDSAEFSVDAGKELTVLIPNTDNVYVCSTNRCYSTLSSAISETSTNDTVIILRDISLDSTVTIPSGKNIVLDLCGKTIKLNFEGSSSSSSGYLGIENKGNLDVRSSIVGGKIVPEGNTYPEYIINNTGDGTVDFHGGTLKLQSATYGSKCVAIGNKKGTVKLTGGHIEMVDLHSLAYKSYLYGILSESGNVNIEAGGVTVSNQENDPIAVQAYAISANGTVNMSGGKIIINQKNNNAPDEINAISKNTGSSSGNLTVNMSGGSIEMDSAYSSSYSGYGIYADNVTLGTKGGEVNTNTPLVKGYFETISATKINFYDGRIITRVSDPISNKNITCESGYAVRTYKYGENSNYQVDLNYKVLILEKIVAHENNTNIDYASLQEAIDSANSTDITLKGAVTETINIPDNYTVKIEQGVYDMRRY